MRITPRAAWGARPPANQPVRLKLPTPRLWLHHTAIEWHGSGGVRNTQNFHMDTRGWSDIAYSFLVDDDGLVYEGRGAGVVGSHTAGDNSASHAITCMGDFTKRQPTERMVRAVAELVAHGHACGWWPARITGGHRDAPRASTACPGDRLQRMIPHINAMTASGPVEEQPLPAPVDFTHYEEDYVKTRLVPVRIVDGKGWATWDPGSNRPPIIVGVVLNGRDPGSEGYTDPMPTVAASVRGNAVLIEVVGARGGNVGVHVSVA